MNLHKLSANKTQAYIRFKFMKVNLNRVVIFISSNVFITNISASERLIEKQPTLKITTFNFSMDATNYSPEREISTGTKPFNRQLTNSDVATQLFSVMGSN